MKQFVSVCLAAFLALSGCVPPAQAPPPQPRVMGAPAPLAAVAAVASNITWHASTLPFIGIPTTPNNYYVSPTGSDSNPGTLAAPKSFAFVRQGCQPCSNTTIWMRGGDYNTVADGQYNTNLYGSGAPGAPLWVRPYQPAPYLPERVTIRVNANQWYGGMTANGKHVRYVGIEWTPALGTNSDRITDSPGSTPGADASHFGGGFVVHPVNTGLIDIKLIAAIVHDNQFGVASQTPYAPDFEMSDSLIYYNGWLSTVDRSHGHGVYPQGPCTGAIGHRYINNIVQHSASYGVHFYGSGSICNNDVYIEGLDAGPTGDMPGFNAGNLLLLGGSNVTKRFNVKNSLFFVPSGDGNSVRVGYSPWPANSITDGHFNGNVFAGGLWLESGRINLVSGIDISSNSFRGTPDCPPPPAGCWAGYKQTDFPNNDWNTATGHGFVRPSQYVAGLAHVSVWNKGGDAVVSVPFDQTRIPIGAPYEIRYAGNYYGPKVTGVYQGGNVDFPMTGWTEAEPDGNMDAPPSPMPFYGVFIVQQTGGASSTTPTPTSTPTSLPSPPPPSATAIPPLPTATATAVPPTFTPSPTPTATPVPPSPSSTATAVPPTATPTPIPPSVTATVPPPTASQTPSSTASPVPTATKTPTKSQTPTRTPTKTPTGSLTKRVCDLEKKIGFGPCAVPTP